MTRANFPSTALIEEASTQRLVNAGAVLAISIHVVIFARLILCSTAVSALRVAENRLRARCWHLQRFSSVFFFTFFRV